MRDWSVNFVSSSANLDLICCKVDYFRGQVASRGRFVFSLREIEWAKVMNSQMNNSSRGIQGAGDERLWIGVDVAVH